MRCVLSYVFSILAAPCILLMSPPDQGTVSFFIAEVRRCATLGLLVAGRGACHCHTPPLPVHPPIINPLIRHVARADDYDYVVFHSIQAILLFLTCYLPVTIVAIILDALLLNFAFFTLMTFLSFWITSFFLCYHAWVGAEDHNKVGIPGIGGCAFTMEDNWTAKKWGTA